MNLITSKVLFVVQMTNIAIIFFSISGYSDILFTFCWKNWRILELNQNCIHFTNELLSNSPGLDHFATPSSCCIFLKLYNILHDNFFPKSPRRTTQITQNLISASSENSRNYLKCSSWQLVSVSHWSNISKCLTTNNE